ncbi:MAG: glycosyltransferase [Rivularia sp. (in: Bacteria)]|nr:glycosyltransferase [Rivularia sp. MS3]
MSEPQVTIIVSPRERFSYTRESLESIYENTQVPFKLIYVDGNSPKNIREYLQNQAQEKDFQLIRTDYYLTPNRARNIGLAQVDTKYVAFVDNDIIPAAGWLKALIDCSEDTEATIVGPLMFQYLPLHEEIHFAGGESHIVVDQKGRRRLREKMYKQGKHITDPRVKLQRTETELCEFHVMLVRTEIFQRLGMFDEQMLNTKEHLDFCMNVVKNGGKVYFEPSSKVTYVPTSPLKFSDLHYYMLRWSNAWELESLSRLRQKWNLAEDGYFQHKYKALGWRRRDTILMPIVRVLSLGIQNQFLHKVVMYGLLAPVEKLLNRYLTSVYAKKHLQPKSIPAINQQQLSEV